MAYSFLLCNCLFFRNYVLKILILSSVATGQRKKSNLKKCREELQLHVVGWFRGRSGWARRLICRGRLLGTSDLADGY